MQLSKEQQRDRQMPINVGAIMGLRAEEALIGTLACAMAADGRYMDEERRLLDFVCEFHRFTRDLSDSVYEEIAERIKLRLDATPWETLIEQYLTDIPEEWLGTTFCLCLDMLLIDGRLDNEEMDCINIISDKLGIPKTDLNRLIVVFMEKNAVSTTSDVMMKLGT